MAHAEAGIASVLRYVLDDTIPSFHVPLQGVKTYLVKGQMCGSRPLLVPLI